MSFSNKKKIKSYCNTKYPTKDQIRKYKRKVNQCVYNREDLAYNLIRYSKLGVTKTDEFRINFAILNNQSVRTEIEIVAIIMKIFAMESKIRQHKIDRLLYDVELCITVRKLVVEIDEDRNVYYDEKNNK